MSTEKVMTERFTVALSPELKEEFYKKCEDSLINPSLLIREMIINFIKE